jgi:hypothetical protein
MREKQRLTSRRPDPVEPFRIRLPGFIQPGDRAVGLGDAISRVTYAAGINPCGACRRRAARLNRWVVFTR